MKTKSIIFTLTVFSLIACFVFFASRSNVILDQNSEIDEKLIAENCYEYDLNENKIMTEYVLETDICLSILHNKDF